MTAPGSDPLRTPPGSDPLRTSPGTTAPTSAGAPPTGRTTSSGTPSRARSAGRTAGLGLVVGLLLFVTVLLVLFVVFNGQTVQVSLVFTDVQAPLVVALLIAAGLGALVAALFGLVLKARRRSR